MRGRRLRLSLARVCCCGDTGSAPALPISHTSPLSHPSDPLRSPPAPCPPCPGSEHRPGRVTALRSFSSRRIPVPPPRRDSPAPGASRPQEPERWRGWRGSAPAAAAAPPAVLPGAGGAPEQLPGRRRVTVAQPMPAQIKAECRSVIQPLALKSFMKRLNCSASSRAISESVPMAPRPSPGFGASGGSGTAPAAERAQLRCGNSPLSPSERGAVPHLWVP